MGRHFGKSQPAQFNHFFSRAFLFSSDLEKLYPPNINFTTGFTTILSTGQVDHFSRVNVTDNVDKFPQIEHYLVQNPRLVYVWIFSNRAKWVFCWRQWMQKITNYTLSQTRQSPRTSCSCTYFSWNLASIFSFRVHAKNIHWWIIRNSNLWNFLQTGL